MVSAPATPDLTLWGVGTARTLRPHWALSELGLPYVTIPMLPRTGETQTAEFTQLNPRQKLPLLRDGDFTIGESAAIIAYLASVYGHDSVRLSPAPGAPYAQWLEWCFFIVTELDSTSIYVMRRHSDLKHLYGDAPVVVREAGQYFLKQLRHVESALDDGRQFIVGGEFTTADILLSTCLRWGIDYKVGITPLAHRYLERIEARPAFAKANAANDAAANAYAREPSA